MYYFYIKKYVFSIRVFLDKKQGSWYNYINNSFNSEGRQFPARLKSVRSLAAEFNLWNEADKKWREENYGHGLPCSFYGGRRNSGRKYKVRFDDGMITEVLDIEL